MNTLNKKQLTELISRYEKELVFLYTNLPFEDIHPISLIIEGLINSIRRTIQKINNLKTEELIQGGQNE